MSRDQAEQIVEVLIKDLSGRKGLGDEWDNIDGNTKREIKTQWALLIIHTYNDK